jgi:hypothetical protein
MSNPFSSISQGVATVVQAVQYALVDSNFVGILDYDSFVSFKITEASTISTFPVEQGAFVSYNKAGHPYKATVRLALTGTPARRQAFITALRTLRKSTSLFTIVTPDASYENANLVSYDCIREANHNAWGRVVVDLHCEEVRVVNLQYTSTVNPGAAPSASTGKVVPTPYAVAQASVWGLNYNAYLPGAPPATPGTPQPTGAR